VALYFFDIDDGRPVKDETGVELPNLALACREAMEAAGRIIIDSADQFTGGKTWQMFVRDRDEQTRYWITVISSEPVPCLNAAGSSRP
jgi:hypothetical protein